MFSSYSLELIGHEQMTDCMSNHIRIISPVQQCPVNFVQLHTVNTTHISTSDKSLYNDEVSTVDYLNCLLVFQRESTAGDMIRHTNHYKCALCDYLTSA